MNLRETKRLMLLACADALERESGAGAGWVFLDDQDEVVSGQDIDRRQRVILEIADDLRARAARYRP